MYTKPCLIYVGCEKLSFWHACIYMKQSAVYLRKLECIVNLYTHIRIFKGITNNLLWLFLKPSVVALSGMKEMTLL